MVFPVVRYRCESWTIKKAERWRRFQIVMLENTLFRVPRTTRRSNQSVLKEIKPQYSLEGLMLKLKNFGHLMRRADSLEKTLGNIEGKRRRGRLKIRWLDSITDSMDTNLSKLQAIMEDREACLAVVHGVTKSRTWISNWTRQYFSPLTDKTFLE